MLQQASADAVRATRVVKRFRGTTALDGVDLSVPRGSISVLTGANGAGKTTLLRVFATLLVPDAGTAAVAGADVVAQPDRVRRAVGVALVNERGLYWRLSGFDNLVFFGRLDGARRADARAQARALLEQVGLGHVGDKRVAAYSAGQRQRLILARALLGAPPVLLLDEPMRGLDEEGVARVRALLRARTEAGGTVLIAAPTMDGIEGLGDDVIELRQGAIVERRRSVVGVER
ncbi:MAG TPA: ABC transporter ATP-binding protein [Actinomycetota bacterium]